MPTTIRTLPQARFVANAFVQLGHYYLEGIPNTDVKADPDRAREMFAYAASYFGDADAQYNLARMYLDGVGGARSAPGGALAQARRQQGPVQAQALLGHMLFEGENVPRQAARGLMWLTLARDSARGREAWIARNARRRVQAGERRRAPAGAGLSRALPQRPAGLIGLLARQVFSLHRSIVSGLVPPGRT